MKSTRLFVLLGAMFLAGCVAPQKPVFENLTMPVEWPKPPDQPRIRYIGQLTGEDSLHAQRKSGEIMKEIISGPRTKWGFSTPTAVVARGSHVYVTDGQSHALFLLDLDARTFKAVRDADGKPMEWPADVCLTDDGIAVADSKRPGIFLFDSDGKFQRSLGGGALMRPCAIAWNHSDQSFWLLDAAKHCCVLLDATGNVKTQYGERGTEIGKFNYPAGLARTADGGAIIADSMNFRVQQLDSLGKAVKSYGKKGDAAGDFALPRDITIDRDGHTYVLDNQFENIQIFDQAGQLLMAFGQEGRGPGEFYLPSGISIDEQDRIWVADTYNRRVQVFQYLREPPPAGRSIQGTPR